MSARAPFRRRSALDRYSLHFGPNMTPMVDVVMVILVFFMTSAAFVGPEWFLSALLPAPAKAPPSAAPTPPPAGGAGAGALAPVRLDLALDATPAGGVTLTGLGLTAASLEDGLAALAAFVKDTPTDQVELLLKPAAGVPYRDVIRVHEAAEALGLTRVGILVSPPPTVPPA